MNAGELDRLLRPNAAPGEERGAEGVAFPEGISAGVMERIGKGWDPWREDLTAWLKRYWPLGVAVAGMATAGLVAYLPHGRHFHRVQTQAGEVSGAGTPEYRRGGPLLGQWP